MVEDRQPHLKPTNSKLEVAPLGEYSLANHRKLTKLQVIHLTPVTRRAPLILIAAFTAAQVQAAQVTNVIDSMTTFQSLTAENNSVTNTVASGGAIGGYRTTTLSSTGNDPGIATTLSISAANQRMTLSTPEGPTPSFQLLWGGLGGTNGLGGVAFGGGQPLDLFTSFLSFSLRSTDQESNFTWSFTDTSNITASYVGTFPVHSSTNPLLPFDIALSSFSNTVNINWNAIDLIVFSGGGATGMDMSVPAPFQVVASTVPEPGTWALLVTCGATAAAFAWRRRNRSRT